MSDKPKPSAPADDDVTRANQDANRQFNGDQPAPGVKLPEAEDEVTKANHEANAEFNGQTDEAPLDEWVGGLRGPAD